MKEYIAQLFDKTELIKIKNKVKKINKLEEKYSKLSDEELKNKTNEFKERIKNGESLDNLLYDAYAVVREASKRVLKMRHYDVQIMGGIVLHEGHIAEMKTGEGKTLVATLPAYLNALTGKGVHVVTANDYLAKRDYEITLPLYNFLGLTVGVIQHDMEKEERKNAYAQDITYVTNSEIGFDYLRDNLVRDKKDKVLRGLHYAIIDEADSILIDEARTPLIISMLTKENTNLYVDADKFVKTLKVYEITKENENEQINKEEYDVIVNKTEKQVLLTERGAKKAEEYFKLENYSDPENFELIHCINQALRANFILKKDIDYIIVNNKIELVDEFTGRVLKGRMYSNGLHQAVEAKEGLEISPENKTIASITYQNLFNLYEKKAGMTGTAKTEEEEFNKVYKMSVIVIPTNKPVIRKDLDDLVFLTKEEKYEAIIEDIKKCYEIKRPVLIGTPNIQVSEEISNRLNKIGIPHNVLNAKNHEKEAEIIKQAGQLGAVTVATNMAGRGTDIKLGEGVRELGGLKVIGVERNESRRIDNQLIGRSGRQGDPGESVFYLSLEDDLFKLYGTNKYIMMFKAMNLPKGKPIKSKMLTKAIRNAQKNLEEINFNIRRSVMQFDTVVNKQREIIYKDRDRLLELDDIIDNILNMVKYVLQRLESKYQNDDVLKNKIKEIFNYDVDLNTDIYKQIEKYYLDRIQIIDRKRLSAMYKDILISIVDYHWSNYINEIELLQKEATLQIYANKDPVIEFINQSSMLFKNLNYLIQKDFLRTIFNNKFEVVLSIM